jgi:hypothetical protein
MSASPLRVAGIALILAGAMALAYGGITYTKHTDELKIGPIELSIQEKQTFNLPVWAGLGAIAVGAVLLLVRKKD